jgi:hypothetical protein
MAARQASLQNAWEGSVASGTLQGHMPDTAPMKTAYIAVGR